MQTKNNILIFVCFFITIFSLSKNLYADEFDIKASEIAIDKENDTLAATGSVEARDNTGKVIKADKIFYERSKEFLNIEGNVTITDVEGNILKTSKASYDKINNKIVAYESTQVEFGEGYSLTTNGILYDTLEKIISSNRNTSFIDSDGNKIEVNMFQYLMKENIFSSVGEITIVDINNNKYLFKELHVDTKKKEMIGSDISAALDQENFGLTKKSDPRFVANDIFISKDKSVLSKGVFTVCQKREGKCPPWSLKAKKILHDKVKKTIYYENATLKVFDVPIFYFPRFFHPDPTVSRQSGFLSPILTNSTNLGTGFGLPYFWAIGNDRDLTFTPKLYASQNPLFLNEYRRAFANANFILDTSYTAGYKKNDEKKTKGSRSHVFSKLDIDLAKDLPYESNININIQKTSNDTFFRVHDVNTALVNSSDTDLESMFSYNFKKDNTFLNVSASLYENLRIKDSSRYEYVLPNIMFGKTFFTEKSGIIDFSSSASYTNYETNRHKGFITNDVIWSPVKKISKNGFVNTIKTMVRNTNYKATNTLDYKNQGTINELNGVVSYKASLPLKKEGLKSFNLFSPNFMLRYAPGHMRDIGNSDQMLKYTNLYALNRTSEIEDGISAVLGFDFKYNQKNEDNTETEKLSLSLGQVFSDRDNSDIPSQSSLDQKSSDVVGEFKYNFSNIGAIDYKFSVDHNLNDLNYNEVSTSLNFNKVKFNLNYLEEQNHIGKEHYVSSGVSLNFTQNNSLSFSTKKNFKTESTEFYNASYQYNMDCLTAGLLYRREFYEDSDIEQKDSFMFTIKFIPFGGVKTPNLNY